MNKLHLGAGRNLLPGWTNTDNHMIVQKHQSLLQRTTQHLDITKKFDLESNFFDYIFTEHVIEHISYHDGVNMLTESYRVLKPGGRIRISTPDLEFLIQMYLEKNKLMEEYIKFSAERYNLPGDTDTFIINNFVREWGHEFIYDKKTMISLLERIGFKDIKMYNIRESDDEHLCNLENASRLPDGFLQLETFTIEASK
jgi:predicted SAM-dependent methyltransferase